MDVNPPEVAALLDRARGGDPEALGLLLERDRARLHRMVRLRLEGPVVRRADVSDVVQEVHLEAVRRIGEYLRGPPMPFYLWLRLLARQTLVDVYRRHAGTAKRDVRREESVGHDALLAVTSVALAEQVVGSMPTPSRAADRAEAVERVRAALETLEPLDREVLALRHFEQMGNDETAEALGIERSAASKRYVRALRRLGEALGAGGNA